MEIGLREMLIFMAIIVIAVIALDIFKRMRHNRQALKFKLEPIPETLDDPLAVEIGAVRKAYQDPAQHARFDNIDEAYDDIERPQLQQLKTAQHSKSSTTVKESPQTQPIVNDEVPPSKPHSSSVSSPRVASEATKAAAQQRAANKSNSRNRSYGTDPKIQAAPATVAPTDVIILNIMARPQNHFTGEAIVKAALMCGLRYGENQIFHFYEPCGPTLRTSTKKENAIFSLVNIVKPGIFDLDKMQDFTSPGLCIFMSIPGPENIETSFQKMLMVAHKLANQLDTDLYDDLHNLLTQKRLKQMHERIVQLHQAQLQNTPGSLHEVHSDNSTHAKIASA